MRKQIVCVILAAGLSGCGHAPTRMDSALVQFSQVLGALKCAFATALAKENQTGNIPSLAGQVANGRSTSR